MEKKKIGKQDHLFNSTRNFFLLDGEKENEVVRTSLPLLIISLVRRRRMIDGRAFKSIFLGLVRKPSSLSYIYI